MSALRNFLSKIIGSPPSPSRGSSEMSGALPTARRLSSSVVELDDSLMFRFPASENMIGAGGSEKLLRAIKSFAPSQPIQHISQFAGRSQTLTQIITAIEEHRNHLVLFGGRGTGKTSLAMAMSSVAKRVGYHCAYVSCSRESTIDSIFRSALADLPIRFDEHFDPRSSDVDPNISFSQLIPEGHVAPQALADVLARIRGTRVLIVIDEYDRNENPTLSRDMTEIMKVVSDRAIPVQIVIVGVGDLVDNLVGEHTSIARVLYVVRLTNMSEDQIRDTLAVASRYGDVEMKPEVVDAIVAISHGRPYIARLVGLKAAKMALLRGATTVDIADFHAGTEELLGYLDSAGFGHAERLIGGSVEQVALFTAMLSCKRDASDRFTIADICAALPMSGAGRDVIPTVQRAVEVIASPEYGLLHVVKGPVSQYQFADPRAELCVSILCSRAAGRRAAYLKQDTLANANV